MIKNIWEDQKGFGAIMMTQILLKSGHLTSFVHNCTLGDRLHFLQFACFWEDQIISMVFFSLSSLPSTVLSTTNLHVLNVVRHVESMKNFQVNQLNKPYHIQLKKIPTEVIHSICQQPPWSSSPNCPRRPQCCRPPNHMGKKQANGVSQ